MQPLIALGLLAGALAATPVPAADQLQAGRGRPVTYEADGAWIRPDLRIAPAFVTVQGGKVVSVRRTRPERGPRPIKLEGTLVPGVVDAWSGLLPEAAARGGRSSLQVRVADELPPDLPGADPALAAAVRLARQGGVAAVWLTPPADALERGVGLAATFSVNDLPVAAGREAVEIALATGASGAAGRLRVEQFADRLEAALARREAREDYEEKLEKYEKDLEEYQKKLEEWAEKKKKKEEEKEQDSAGTDDAPGGEEKPQGEKAAGKDDEPPKRPVRPRPPGRDPALDLLLDVLDGRLPLRVQADRVRDIRRLLSLKEHHDFDFVLLGGDEADLVAEELAEAKVPVVLSAEFDRTMAGAPDRSFSARYLVLHRAGVKVAIGSGGSRADAYLLLMRAGQAVAAGAGEAAVWASLTTVPAGILGLSETYGRLGRGTSADFLLVQGDSPFDASRPLRPNLPGGTLP